MRNLSVVSAVVVSLAAAFCWLPDTFGQESLGYAELVGRLIDLEHLAVLPAEGETCRQWSSWDRKSEYDAATGEYVHWDANNDGPNFIRQEGDTFVLAEMEGPGCIWRTWSARAEKGHVKIFLDGAEEPAVDLPFENYFSGSAPPFDYPILSYNLSDLGCRGQNLYMPIPYQKSCKVVADPGWGRYYQFVYTTYPKGTEVPTFSSQLAADNVASLKKVNDFLRDRLGKEERATTSEGERTSEGRTSEGDSPIFASRKSGQSPVRHGQEMTTQRTVRLGPGECKLLDGLRAGPRAITSIRARMHLSDREEQMAALRKVTLAITWDDEVEPAVWCPLGDFFGTAPGENLYKSLVTGMTEDGWYAHWYMPYAKKARVEVTNEDTVPRQVELEIVDAPLFRPIEQLGRFHLKWHRDVGPLSEDRWPDWVMLNTEGRGRYCGVMLHVWDPRPGWWGEGDEKFFVDGEKYPSTFGTGSEDFFGYAWCNPGLFQRPFHGQTMTQQNQGHQSLFRWQIADNVPFRKSFQGCIEKYHRTEEWGTQYAVTVAWYLAPGGVDPYGPVPVEQRLGYYVRPPLVAGGFKVLGQPKGMVRTQAMSRYEGKWKNNDQLWWIKAAPGDELEVAVPVEKPGNYRVSVVLTKARDYGVVELAIDHRPAGEAVDLYNPTVIRTEPILLGTFQLEAGEHVLGVRIRGANDKAVKSYMFGLDEVLLEPQP